MTVLVLSLALQQMRQPSLGLVLGQGGGLVLEDEGALHQVGENLGHSGRDEEIVGY